MIGHGWVVGVRSQLVNLASECMLLQKDQS